MSTGTERAVFWYGCNMTRHGELIRTSKRLLEAVGVMAEPAGGPGHCCGAPKEAAARIAGGMGERTVQKFNATGAPGVVTWCPTCHMNMQDIMAPATAPAFAMRHVSEVLHEARERLLPLLVNPVPLRVLVHEHLGFDARVPVNTLVPDLLRMIPGIVVLEHGLRVPGHMCSAIAGVPGALRQAQCDLLEAASAAGAEAVVTIFHSCHRELVTLERGRDLQVLNWVHLLARSIGWEAVDEYKAWRNSEDPREVIGEERIAAAGEVAFGRLTEPELRRAAVV